MRIPSLPGLTLGLALLLAGGPAVAQQQPIPAPTPQRPLPDRLEPEPDAPQAEEGNVPLMDLPLPLRNGQILRYHDDQGNLTGFATRRKLTIRFYDAAGNYLGRADRVSQLATRYFDADGTYLGRRLHRRLVTQADIHPEGPAPRQPEP